MTALYEVVVYPRAYIMTSCMHRQTQFVISLRLIIWQLIYEVALVDRKAFLMGVTMLS